MANEGDITYSFKEMFDRFERDVRASFVNMNTRLDTIETKTDRRFDAIDAKTDKNTEALANIHGRLLVWGAIGIIIGTAISGLVVKFVGA